jgi:Rod binding domain-containing protein
MSAINLSSQGDSTGAMLALGNRREEREAARAEAIRAGRGIQNQEQLEKKVRSVAEDFVSVFMNQVMKSMRNTVQETDFMHGDNGEKFFQEMLDTEQSKQLAKGSGYGLTNLIYESMMASYRVQRQPGETAAPADGNYENYEAALEAEATPDLEVQAIR